MNRAKEQAFMTFQMTILGALCVGLAQMYMHGYSFVCWKVLAKMAQRMGNCSSRLYNSMSSMVVQTPQKCSSPLLGDKPLHSWPVRSRGKFLPDLKFGGKLSCERVGSHPLG